MELNVFVTAISPLCLSGCVLVMFGKPKFLQAFLLMSLFLIVSLFSQLIGGFLSDLGIMKVNSMSLVIFVANIVLTVLCWIYILWRDLKKSDGKSSIERNGK